MELTPIQRHGLVFVGGVVFNGAFGDGYLAKPLSIFIDGEFGSYVWPWEHYLL